MFIVSFILKKERAHIHGGVIEGRLG